MEDDNPRNIVGEKDGEVVERRLDQARDSPGGRVKVDGSVHGERTLYTPMSAFEVVVRKASES